MITLSKDSPILKAIREGNTKELADWLVTNPENANAITEEKSPILKIAIDALQLRAVDLLLCKGARLKDILNLTLTFNIKEEVGHEIIFAIGSHCKNNEDCRSEVKSLMEKHICIFKEALKDDQLDKKDIIYVNLMLFGFTYYAINLRQNLNRFNECNIYLIQAITVAVDLNFSDKAANLYAFHFKQCGNMLYNLRLFAEAEDLYASGLKFINPNNKGLVAHRNLDLACCNLRRNPINLTKVKVHIQQALTAAADVQFIEENASNSIDIRSILTRFGDELYKLHFYSEAEQVYTSALKLTNPNNKVCIVQANLNLTRCNVQMIPMNLIKVKSFIEQACITVSDLQLTQENASNLLEVTSALSFFVSVLFEFRLYSEAEQVLASALKLVNPTNKVWIVQTNLNLAHCYVNMNPINLIRVKGCIEQALIAATDVQFKENVSNLLEVASRLSSLGNVLYKLEFFSEAEQVYASALTLTRPSNKVSIVHANLNLAWCNVKMNPINLIKVKGFIEQTLTAAADVQLTQETASNLIDVALRLRSFGKELFKLHFYSEAEVLYTLALKFINLDNKVLIANGNLDLACCNLKINPIKLAEAKIYIKQALTASADLLFIENDANLNVLWANFSQCGSALFTLQFYSEAEQMYCSHLKLTNSNNKAKIARINLVLLECNTRINPPKLPEAKKYLKQALEAAETLKFINSSTHELGDYFRKAGIYFNRGNTTYTEAKSCFKVALTLLNPSITEMLLTTNLLLMENSVNQGVQAFADLIQAAENYLKEIKSFHFLEKEPKKHDLMTQQSLNIILKALSVIRSTQNSLTINKLMEEMFQQALRLVDKPIQVKYLKLAIQDNKWNLLRCYLDTLKDIIQLSERDKELCNIVLQAAVNNDRENTLIKYLVALGIESTEIDFMRQRNEFIVHVNAFSETVMNPGSAIEFLGMMGHTQDRQRIELPKTIREKIALETLCLQDKDLQIIPRNLLLRNLQALLAKETNVHTFIVKKQPVQYYARNNARDTATLAILEFKNNYSKKFICQKFNSDATQPITLLTKEILHHKGKGTSTKCFRTFLNHVLKDMAVQWSHLHQLHHLTEHFLRQTVKQACQQEISLEEMISPMVKDVLDKFEQLSGQKALALDSYNLTQKLTSAVAKFLCDLNLPELPNEKFNDILSSYSCQPSFVAALEVEINKFIHEKYTLLKQGKSVLPDLDWIQERNQGRTQVVTRDTTPISIHFNALDSGTRTFSKIYVTVKNIQDWLNTITKNRKHKYDRNPDSIGINTNTKKAKKHRRETCSDNNNNASDLKAEINGTFEIMEEEENQGLLSKTNQNEDTYQANTQANESTMMRDQADNSDTDVEEDPSNNSNKKLRLK